VPETTGRPAYHPSVLLKLYIYGYLNRVQSSRRLEREAGRNVEVMWLTGRLVPDHETIADFRKDNGGAIRKICTRFVGLGREMGLLSAASVAIDGSKFKAVNNRDRAKMARRRAQIEAIVARYLQQLETADRQEPSEALAAKTIRLRAKIAQLGDEMRRLADIDARMSALRPITTASRLASWIWTTRLTMLTGRAAGSDRLDEQPVDCQCQAGILGGSHLEVAARLIGRQELIEQRIQLGRGGHRHAERHQVAGEGAAAASRYRFDASSLESPASGRRIITMRVDAGCGSASTNVAPDITPASTFAKVPGRNRHMASRNRAVVSNSSRWTARLTMLTGPRSWIGPNATVSR
jgi:hypothetical protein